MNGPGLLHNMSSMPKTTISCGPPDSPEPFRYVLLDPVVQFTSACPSVLLGLLDGARWTGTGNRAAEAELRRRVNEHARGLPLPAIVLLGHMAQRETHICQDLLTAITIWSKSSPKLYLRDKEPRFSWERNRTVLHLPPGVPPIGEEVNRSEP